MKLLNILYNKFPRQIAIPYRILVEGRGQFYQLINKYNGRKRVFASVYNYTGGEYFDKVNLDVDKIFIDIDGEEESFDDAERLATYLMRKNYKFTMVFSGGGFHFYVFTKNFEKLVNKKLALLKSHLFFKNKLKIDIDEHIIGDLARVATVPYTLNVKRKKFAIPVKISDFSNGYDFICEKAKKQFHSFEIYGEKGFDIKKFDNGEEDFEFCVVEYDDKVKAKIDDDKLLRELPPCIAALLANGNHKRAGWRGRFLIIVFLRDKGLPPGNIAEIIKKYLTTTKNGKPEWKHCLYEEKQVSYLFRKDDNMFPTCERVKTEGFCPIKDFCEFSREWGDTHLVNIYK